MKGLPLFRLPLASKTPSFTVISFMSFAQDFGFGVSIPETLLSPFTRAANQ